MILLSEQWLKGYSNIFQVLLCAIETGPFNSSVDTVLKTSYGTFCNIDLKFAFSSKTVRI